jgi:beta-glucosidase/6-phospho-beta-glucosidase/beta-galactosidase
MPLRFHRGGSLATLVGIAFIALAVSAAPRTTAMEEQRCFPDNFMFGVATAAPQVEGAWNESGRTPSIWDDFCRERPELKCANVADDFYHRYKSDIQLMADMGLQSFRLSISWSRIMNWDAEARQMKLNPAGLSFYHSLIDELRANSIEPILTIYHWDLPSELQTELSPPGWLNPAIGDHFTQFATLLFREFGAQVKFWTTFNEPFSFVGMGYGTGIHAPGFRGSETQAYTVSHHALVAHGRAVKSFRDLRASGVVRRDARIGMVLVSQYYYPLDPSNPKDVAAAKRGLEFDFGWFLEPMLTGDFPAVMRERAGDKLPRFTEEEAALVKGSYDLLMMNHYASRLVQDCDAPSSRVNCSSLSAGWEADKGLDDTHIVPGSRVGKPDRYGNIYCEQDTAYPPGYLAMIKWVHAKDPTADILLTENGWCGSDEIENGEQLAIYQAFLEQVHTAIVEDKIPVIGYTAWSFLDNYEWGYYTTRFGLFYVDFPPQAGTKDGYTPLPSDLARVPRPAAKWFSQLAKTKCLPPSDGWMASPTTAAASPELLTVLSDLAAMPSSPAASSAWALAAIVFGGVLVAVAAIIRVFGKRPRTSRLLTMQSSKESTPLL